MKNSKATAELMKKRTGRKIHKIIGLKSDGGEYVALEEVFDYGDGLRGATGCSLHVVTNGEYEERMDPKNAEDHFEDVWRSMVADGTETDSLSEFTKRVLKYDGYNAVFDMSYSWMHDECIAMHDAAVRKAAAEEQGVSIEEADVDEDALGHLCECGGCGRMFCKDGTHGEKWADFKELTADAAECIKLIAEYEKYTMAEEENMRAKEQAKYASK